MRAERRWEKIIGFVEIKKFPEKNGTAHPQKDEKRCPLIVTLTLLVFFTGP